MEAAWLSYVLHNGSVSSGAAKFAPPCNYSGGYEWLGKRKLRNTRKAQKMILFKRNGKQCGLERERI
jgi:hypothetical protein